MGIMDLFKRKKNDIVQNNNEPANDTDPTIAPNDSNQNNGQYSVDDFMAAADEILSYDRMLSDFQRVLREQDDFDLRAAAASALSENAEKLHELQKSLNSGTLKFLNTRNVSGLWVFNNWFYNDRKFPLFLIRTSFSATSVEWLHLVEEIYSIVPHENAFNYDADYIGSNDDDLTERIRREVWAKGLFTLHDSEK